MENQMTRYRWRIVALLFTATTINYLDRQVLGLLKPTLEGEFGWTEADFSHIIMAFQAAYAISLIGFGAIIDRYRNKAGLYNFGSCLEPWRITTRPSNGHIQFRLYACNSGARRGGKFPGGH